MIILTCFLSFSRESCFRILSPNSNVNNIVRSMDAPQLPADGYAGAARATSVPRVLAPCAGVRAMGPNGSTARPVLPQSPLRRTIATGTCYIELIR